MSFYIVSLPGCTAASAGESSKWKQIVTNAADSRRNLHQILQRIGVHSDLARIRAEVLTDLNMVLKQGASKVQPNDEPVAEEDFVNGDDVSGIPQMTMIKSQYARRWS
jgi:hypothetical protein